MKGKISEMNRFVLCASAMFAFTGVFAGESGLGKGGENTPRPYWTVAPDAERLLAEMREQAKAYRPRAQRMGLFSRAQLKYGAQRTDFIHNWYERPLHQNSAWAKTGNPRRIIHPDAWKKTVEAVRLGKMDGLAVSISQSSRSEVIGHSVTPGSETQVLVELPYGYHEKGVKSFVETARKALAMPNSYRIDGKVVLTRYPAVRESGFDQCETVRKALDAEFGPGKFIVMFYALPFEKRPGASPITAADLQAAREHLRLCLRKMDGLFMSGWDIYGPRRYNPAFERDVLVPLYQSVLAEPEFAGRKYLAVNVTPGHENCYRWSYSLDSQGTRMLCERLKTVLEMRPDFIIGTEWDEENENTQFRPMISHGYVHQRIMRWFADMNAGRPLDVYPGDDTSIPNLVVSYRKSVAAGEPVEVEVRNIPDGTFRSGRFAVSFRWKGLDGKVLREYPAKRLSADGLDAVWFVSPSTEFIAENRMMCPEVTVKTPDGRVHTYGKAFWPIDLNAVRVIDSKWVKHALREQPKSVSGSLSVGKRRDDGTVEVSGAFGSPVEVKSVEVLEGPDTVYMYDPANPRNPDTVTIKLEIRARGTTPGKYKLSGSVRYANAPGLKIESRHEREYKSLPDGWIMKDMSYSNWGRVRFVEMPRASAETAEIVVDLAPLFKTRIRVKDVLEKGVIGISGIAGGNLVVTHYLPQREIPLHCNVKSGAFSFVMRPKDAASVLRMQIVDVNDRVWRGCPSSLFRPSGEKRTVSVFERDEERVTDLTLDAALVPDIAYDFDPSRGSVVWSDKGLSYCGILGGGVSLVSGIGRGESCYGDTIARYLTPKMPGADNNVPAVVDGPDGRRALEFKDCAYVMLPQQLVSKFTGFEISLDVNPDDLNGVQTLVDSGNAAYTFQLKDGVPEFYIFNTVSYAKMTSSQIRARGSKLKAGEWNNVKVTFDQRMLWITVNGEEGRRIPASGSQLQSRYTAIGAANRQLNFFRGRISGLSFKVR